MSNYTLAVGWSTKDTLSDSHEAKVISGADFNTEFSAVQTAVNTKADLNGSVSETFSATTATAGTNTTQVATTQYVTSAIDAIPTVVAFPIGAIFTTVTAYANSAAVVAAIGGTTWVAFAAGKMLIGLDSADTDFDTVEETGGSKTHTLSEAEMPAHKHHSGYGGGSTPRFGVESGLSSEIMDHTPYSNYSTAGAHSSTTGSGDAHSIMNPYIAVYMWKRTA